MEFTVNVNVHLQGQILNDLVKSINRLGDSLMSVTQELKDFAASIDTATTQIGTRIDGLQQRLTNSMTDAELADVRAAFKVEVDKLTAMGKDPADPLPVVLFGAKKKP